MSSPWPVGSNDLLVRGIFLVDTPCPSNPHKDKQQTSANHSGTKACFFPAHTSRCAMGEPFSPAGTNSYISREKMLLKEWSWVNKFWHPDTHTGRVRETGLIAFLGPGFFLVGSD